MDFKILENVSKNLLKNLQRSSLKFEYGALYMESINSSETFNFKFYTDYFTSISIRGYKLNGTKLFTYPSITITMLKVFPNNKNPTTSHRNYFSPSYQGNNTGSIQLISKIQLSAKNSIYIYIYMI